MKELSNLMRYPGVYLEELKRNTESLRGACVWPMFRSGVSVIQVRSVAASWASVRVSLSEECALSPRSKMEKKN
jgi:hypothetical protein